jgi:asparagine synthase (glutamine-hydrolysing)
LVRTLKEGERISTRNFGGFCPYYYRDDESGEVLVGDTAEEMILSIPRNKRRLDAVGCLSLLCFNSPLGDRTLVEGLQRMPWHATLEASGNLERRAPLPHGHRLTEPHEIALALLGCLEEELSGYLEGRKRAWVLLSGGLDSRITAGVIHRIQRNFSAEIGAVTWGTEDSRDVIYASRIARHYGWEWLHLPYDEETLWQNIFIAAEWGGSEVAGVHLHAIKQLGRIVGHDDVVIASSWGDSIGRAEFGGQHLAQMGMRPIVNKHWLIHRSLAGSCLDLARTDRQLAWCTEPDCSRHVIAELDAQENYMRRMIGHAMNYILRFCHLEQAFTADKTVKTMWSYSPVCRQTEVYYRLLENLDPFLFDVPWARTGVAPSGKVEKDFSLKKDYHQWGRWLREGRRKELKNLLYDGHLSTLNVFNMSQVRQCFKIWCREPMDSVGRTEAILQLASIELLQRRFDLICPGDRTDMVDWLMAKAYKVLDMGKRIYPYVPFPIR